MQIKYFFLGMILFLSSTFAAPSIVDVGAWTFDDTNTTSSGIPSNLKFLKFYDLLPDEISSQVLNKRDLTQFAGKHIFIGYGVVDPKGTDCKIFPASATGLDQNITICLPWWRIEREYEKSMINIKDLSNILCEIPTPHPPIKVNVCKTWTNSGALSATGGKVVCTSYYNRLLSKDCWDNPKQAKCFVDNCSKYTKDHCAYTGAYMGDNTTLTTAMLEGSHYKGVATKVDVVSYQYTCPSGSMIPHTDCAEEQSVLMYPYECRADDLNTSIDDSSYIYCDEDKAQYDAGGKIIGFLGTCPENNETVMCDVNSFSQTTNICEEPINATITNTSFNNTVETKTFKEYTVDVLSGETDIYASKPNCVRSNTVDAARAHIITAHIVGSGTLDDDIWVIRHRGDSTHHMVYCNEQHNNSAGSKKMYDGVMAQCISNMGNYAFDQVVPIESTDIVTIQQATENEDGGATSFYARTHYGSSEVKIDGVIAAPRTLSADYPYYPIYPTDIHWLNLWENSLGDLTILFPYAGAYQISFYNKDGDLETTSNISMDDFDEMKNKDYIRLYLVKQVALNPGFDLDNNATNCIDNEFAEFGGGVWGGKDGATGTPCQSPDDNFVKAHAIYKIIVKDLLTGNITPIPLVYPLAYGNRVFVSKLKLYELRKYRCYNNFSEDVLP